MKAIILAAGEGRRMLSARPKALTEVCGRPLLSYVIDTVRSAGADEVIVVVGHRASEVQSEIGESVKYAVQAEQLGTGHAVACAREHITPGSEILVICADTPLVGAECIARLRRQHIADNNAATVLSTVLSDPTGYGRIVCEGGRLLRITEHKDADAATLAINEINTAIYMFNGAMLAEALGALKNDNAAGEYYLTDTLEILNKRGHKIGVHKDLNSADFCGINTQAQLAEAARIMRGRINTGHMNAGVCMIDPEHTYIDSGVTIAAGTRIYPGAILEGKTSIGADCVIGANTRLLNSVLGKSVDVAYSVVLDSEVGDFTTVGPFAYIRPGSRIASHARIGDFVEIKNSQIGDGTKVSHLTYVGDSDVGSGVNFGCGTVTVNYDGGKKYRTTIQDGAFIGCNTNLIAPVTVGQGAYIAAGSTVTCDVPESALAVARARQVNLPDRADKYLKNTH